MHRLSPAPCAPRAGWLALCARLCEHRHSVSVAACVMRSSPRDSTHTEGIRMHTAQRLNALQSPRIQQQSAHSCMRAWLPAYDLSHHFNAGFGAQPRGEKIPQMQQHMPSEHSRIRPDRDRQTNDNGGEWTTMHDIVTERSHPHSLESPRCTMQNRACWRMLACCEERVKDERSERQRGIR